MINFRIAILLLMAVIATGSAEARMSAVRDSLRREFSKVYTATDSLKLYLDLLDTAPVNEQMGLANTIYGVAVRTHNITVQLEMLRHIANLSLAMPSRDSLLNRCEQLAGALPQNKMQRATLVFIDMVRVTGKSRSLPDSARREFFRNEIMSYRGDDKSDLSEQIRHHYTVCLFLGGRFRSPLLASNVEHLGELIHRLPYQMESVRNLYFTQAARMYTIIGDAQRAVTTDREMLRGIRAMQERYNAEGRRFRNYSSSLYDCYRRMLMNYRALAPGEADSIYRVINELAASDPDVAVEPESGGTPKAFYLLAQRRYREAIPLLKSMIDEPALEGYNHIILRELCQAAELAGDHETLRYAMPLYLRNLEARLERTHLSEMIARELDYKLSDFQRSKTELYGEMMERRERVHTYTIVGAVVLTVVLLTLITMLYRLYSRARRLSRTLAQTNAVLTTERDKLKRSERDLIAARDSANRASSLKADFINNMSREVSAPLSAIVEYSQFIVDNMDAGRRRYMQNFADVVVLSAELLQTLVNDVLDTSSFEKAEVEINKRPVSITGICNMVVGNFAHRMRPGVSLDFDDTSDHDSIITTDPQRVEQVLINLLSNAVKFTEEGSVTLSYEFDASRTHVTFAVTDTGIGIPEGKETIIFERFEKLDSHTQGTGLGLYICTLVAKLLGGGIKVDTEYRAGARFLFTIPV